MQAPEEVSKPVEAAPDKTVPAAPRNLKTDVTCESVTLTWEAPESDGGATIKQYVIVMRDADKKKFKEAGQVEATVLTFTVTKVKENHEYFFRVYAENEVGISESAAETSQPIRIPKKEVTNNSLFCPVY